MAYGPFQRLPRITSGAIQVKPLRGYDSHLQTSSLALQIFLPKLKTQNSKLKTVATVAQNSKR
ncbi:hypothetical protein BWI96_09290 [Siphonobacter sp. SORGH_AS_0500]|nr:hypothetical protein BWI96_09290 [Siphonobacter sp. SORGH_AS_0500]